jgi:hypothetical protein
MPAAKARGPKWPAASSGGRPGDREVKAPADRLGHRAKRKALLGDGVIPLAGRAPLERQAEHRRGVEPVHRRPAVQPGAHVGGEPRLTGVSGQVGRQALPVMVVHLGQAHHAGAHAARDRR